MVINTLQGNIEVVGDVKEFKTSIDPKNLEFITTLLSSNLYSDPEQSFIREIVSNAWDSHVEAGTTDIPVIIRFKNSEDEHSITIRDYGTGLSSERFNKIYRNIGSSTKRESNEYIGAFGIGHLSPFACSNSVYIISYYNGIAYYYVGTKSNNTITYHQLMEGPTTEKNGVEITIKGITSFAPYYKALDYIIFFPNIYVEDDEASRVNNVKIKRFKNFAASSTSVSPKLLLGNVLYPCNKDLLPQDTKRFLYRISNTGIVLKFEIGELSITPNRENVIYNSETIKKITDRAKAAEEELNALIAAKAKRDYDDIADYYDILSSERYYDPITGNFYKYSYSYGLGYNISFCEDLCDNITYKGNDLRGYIKILRFINSMIVPNYKGVVYNNKILLKRLPYNVEEFHLLSKEKVLILNAKARMTEATKLYIKRHYDGYYVMSDLTYQEFENWFMTKLPEAASSLKSNLKLVIRGVYDSLINRAKRLDLNNDPDYLAFKNTLSVKPENTNIPAKEVILYTWNDSNWREKLYFKEFQQAVDYIRGLKKGVVLINMGITGEALYSIADLRGYKCIQARKDIINDLKKLNLSCVVDLDWLTKKDPIIASVKTTLKYFTDSIDLREAYSLLDSLSKREREKFSEVVKLRNMYGSDPYYRELAERTDIPYDPYIEHICIKLKNYISKFKKIKNITDSMNATSTDMIAMVAMKTKAYKISYEAYKKIKNNELLRILCRK